MLLNKYKPKSLLEVKGQKAFIKKIENWFDEWKKGKALLIYGPSGAGKSLIPKLIARERNLNVFDVNASDKRKSSEIEEMLKTVSKDSSLSGSRIILIEDLDSVGRSDRGFASEIIRTIKESEFPVIITAKNAYDKKLRSVRSYCVLVKISRIRKDIIRNEIAKISKLEGLNLDYETIRTISENANGDIRSAINDLQIASNSLDSVGYREKEIDIFETLRTIFKSKDYREVNRSIINCDKNVEEIFWWVEENIPNEYEDITEIANAFDLLSKADLFRVKLMETRNYRLAIYIRNMIAAVSLVKKDSYRKYVSYKPPSRLILLGKTKAMRNKMNEFYEVLSKELHCSKRKIREQSPFLKIILGNSYPKFS